MLGVVGEGMQWGQGGTMGGYSPIRAPPRCPNLQKAIPVPNPILSQPCSATALCIVAFIFLFLFLTCALPSGGAIS